MDSSIRRVTLNRFANSNIPRVFVLLAAIFCLNDSLSATPPAFELELPDSEAGQFRWVEWSTDLQKWSPVARDYGPNWENIFPHVLPITEDAGTQTLVVEIDAPARFFRMVGVDTGATPSNAHSISRFLQQATFGPNLAMITSFPGYAASDLNDAPYTYYETWIDSQIAVPMFSLRAFWRERSNPTFIDNTVFSPNEIAHNASIGHQLTYFIGGTSYKADTQDALDAGRSSSDVTFDNNETKRVVWYQAALTGNDQLRQRVAWAISQFFVLGDVGSNEINSGERSLKYYDIFVRHALGNFRDILGEVTYSPHMGYYLTYTDNRKADAAQGTFPDENYAREVMQQFSIGLWMLNQDGTPIMNANGDPVPTYDIGDIEEFAKIFTGLRRQSNRTNIEIRSNNYTDPMKIHTSWHDYSEKTLLDGSTIGPFPVTEQGAFDEIDALLDHLFNHQNTPPFFARFLIQRFTISNPSPHYIDAVAQAFTDGTYNGLGTGERGDMTATIKAVLLHPEAREGALAFDSAHGALREPLIRIMHVARALNITSPQTYGLLPFDNLYNLVLQAPFEYPTVFNFYLPEYQPTGVILERDIYSPEFQIHNDVTALNLANAIRKLVYEGISGEIGFRSYSQGDLYLIYETGIAGDASALLDHLDLILTAGRLTPTNRTTLLTALNSLPGTSDVEREARVKRALSLFSLLPEFNVIY